MAVDQKKPLSAQVHDPFQGLLRAKVAVPPDGEDGAGKQFRQLLPVGHAVPQVKETIERCQAVKEPSGARYVPVGVGKDADPHRALFSASRALRRASRAARRWLTLFFSSLVSSAKDLPRGG